MPHKGCAFTASLFIAIIFAECFLHLTEREAETVFVPRMEIRTNEAGFDMTDLPSEAQLGPKFLSEHCKTPLFILMHPPKTGGTTVLRNVDAHCRDHPAACTFCCHGHKFAGPLQIDAVAETAPEYRTRCQQNLLTLRHPVSTVVSAFYESKKWLRDPNGLYARCNHFECHSELTLTAMMQDNFTLADAINYSPSPFYVRNKVAHFLLDRALDPDGSGSEHFENLREVLLRRLSRNLDFVFDADHLNEGMALWAAYYNVTLFSYDNQWDYNPYTRLDRDSDLFAMIAKQNSVDLFLYEEAMRMYQLQKERLLKAFYPRVPMNFSCSRPRCGVSPAICISSCSRKRAWAVPKRRRKSGQ